MLQFGAFDCTVERSYLEDVNFMLLLVALRKPHFLNGFLQLFDQVVILLFPAREVAVHYGARAC